MAGYSNQLQDIRNLMFDERSYAHSCKGYGRLGHVLSPTGLAAWHEQLGTEAVLGFVASSPNLIDSGLYTHLLKRTVVNPLQVWTETTLQELK